MAAGIIYAAKSTADVHGSIGTQLEDCRAAAAAEAIAVVAEYSDEAYSAYSGSRGPGLKAAMEHAERLAIDGEVHVFVQHSDRLARGDGERAMHLVEYALWAIKSGGQIKLRSLQDPQTFGDLLYTVVTGQRNHEDSKRKSEATRAGKKREAARGRPHGGIPPYGYRYEGRREDCRIVPDPAEAAIVRRIFEAYVAGESQIAILRALNHDGVPTKRGAPRWAQGTLVAILRNPLYIGKVRHRGELYDGEHESLIDAELWRRVERLRAGRNVGGGARGRRPKGQHLFTAGLLRCGECGEAMVPRSLTTKSGRDRQRDTYVCLGRIEMGPGHCSQRPVARELVDGAALRYFEQTALDVDATRAALEGSTSRRVTEARTLRDQADRELMQKSAAQSRIEADYIAGSLSAEKYEQLSARLDDEAEALAAKNAQLELREREAQADAELDDAEGAVLQRLSDIRAAVVGDVRGAEGIDAVRAALASLFSAFHYSGGQIVPVLRPDAVAGFADDGRPEPRKVALAGAQTRSERPPPYSDLFGPIAIEPENDDGRRASRPSGKSTRLLERGGA